jgi:hypothetical protein
MAWLENNGGLWLAARKYNPASALRQNNPTGKSLLIFGNAVKSLAPKYSA